MEVSAISEMKLRVIRADHGPTLQLTIRADWGDVLVVLPDAETVDRLIQRLIKARDEMQMEAT